MARLANYNLMKKNDNQVGFRPFSKQTPRSTSGRKSSSRLSGRNLGQVFGYTCAISN